MRNKFRKIFRYCEEIICACLLIIMVAISSINIITRYIPGVSFAASEELITNLFVWLTMLGAVIAIKHRSHISITFIARKIPEINDLRVLRALCRQGIGTALVDEAERRIFRKSTVAGIGVGMYADYGPAQRMYVLRGYVPDGMGLYHKNSPVVPGKDYCLDDNLVLYFVKELK